MCQIQENGERRSRKKRKLRTLYADPDVIALVKSKSLRWLGLVQTRGEHQIVKRFWTERPDETRPLERTMMGWTYQVLGDLGRLDFELRMAEGTGNQLRRMVSEAKIHLGIVCSQE